MRLLNVDIRGSKGLKDGIGQDQFKYDFSSLSGLVAISGDNGAGKSTFMEFLTFFRQCPSQTGKFSSLFCLPDSHRDITAEMNGHVYRSLVKMNPETTSPDEGYLWKDGHPLETGGKVSVYDKLAEGIFGSPRLFFASIFSGQEKQRISDYKPADMISLFIEFLRLDEMERYRKTAKAVCDSFSPVKTRLEEERGILVRKLTDTMHTEGNLAADRLKVMQWGAEKTEKVREIEAKKKDLMARGLEKENIQKTIDAKAGREARILEIEKNLRDDDTATEAKIVELRAAYKNIEGDLQKHVTVLEQEGAIKKASADLTENGACIRQADQNLQTANRDLAALPKSPEAARLRDRVAAGEKELEEQTAFDTEAREIHSAYVEEKGEISEAMAALSNDKEIIDSMNEQALLNETIAKLEAKRDREKSNLEQRLSAAKRECENREGMDPDCTSTICKFILSAKKATSTATDIETELKGWDQTEDAASLRQLCEKGDALIQKIAQREHALALKKTPLERRMAKTLAAIQELMVTIQRISNDFAETKRAKAQANEELSLFLKTSTDKIQKRIKEQEARKEALERKRADLQRLAAQAGDIQTARSMKETLTARLVELKKEADGINEAKAARQKPLKGNIQAIWKEILKLPPTDIDAIEKEMGVITASIQAIESDMELMEDRIKHREKDIALAERTLQDRGAWEQRVTAIDQDIAKIARQMMEWKHLESACSKWGIPSLELNAVSPLITAAANQILSETGSPFTIELKVGDNGFLGGNSSDVEIIAYKGDSDPKPFRKLSPGQKVMTNKAVNLALCMVSKEKSGRDFQTAFSDEEDGALSGANAATYVDFHRQFMKKADFQTCVFISHRMEIIGGADHEIKMG